MDKTKLLQEAMGLIQIAHNTTTDIGFKSDCAKFLDDILIEKDIKSLMETPDSSSMQGKAVISIHVDAVGAKAVYSILESILVKDQPQQYPLSLEENIRVFAEFMEYSLLKAEISVMYPPPISDC